MRARQNEPSGEGTPQPPDAAQRDNNLGTGRGDRYRDPQGHSGWLKEHVDEGHKARIGGKRDSSGPPTKPSTSMVRRVDGSSPSEGFSEDAVPRRFSFRRSLHLVARACVSVDGAFSFGRLCVAPRRMCKASGSFRSRREQRPCRVRPAALRQAPSPSARGRGRGSPPRGPQG
jgi:hypothetical protein